MNYMPRLRQAGRVLLLIVGFWTALTDKSSAQAQDFIPGQIILYCQPNTPNAGVQELAQQVEAQVEPLLLKDCYKLILPDDKANKPTTTEAVAKLKMDARVRYVGPNHIGHRKQLRVEPNDPRYSEQFNLRMINMPQAWTLTKGRNGVNVCVIDSGFRPLHEDVQGRLMAESRDFGDNDNDPTAGDDHGTGVASVIAANTNNGIGIASMGWENIRVLALKIGGAQGSIIESAALNAYAYIAQNHEPLGIVSVNMSYGFAPVNPSDTTNPHYIALKAIADTGVILVGATGNNGGSNVMDNPTSYPFVVGVTSLDRNGGVTSYSDTGKVEMSAPGGDFPTATEGILHLTGPPMNYDRSAGTSLASPHVAGAIAMIRSIPNVTSQQALQALYQGANRSGIAQAPDTRYGNGRLDVYGSLIRVSVRAEIETPFGTDPLGNTTDPSGVSKPVETLAPTVRIRISNVPLSASDGAEHIRLTIDGDQQPESFLLNSVESGTTTGSFPQYTLAFRLPEKYRTPGEHIINIQVTNPTSNTTTTDQRRFVITPYVIPSGISFISIPFFESATDSPTNQFREALDLLGRDVTLFRWIYTPTQGSAGQTVFTGKYATLAQSGGDFPDNAKFKAVDAIASANPPNGVSDIRPVGLAYFIRTPAAIPVNTYGMEFAQQEVRLGLHEGWNMVGDPYPYAVPFNTVLVETSTGDRMTIQQAVDQKLILPYIYRFVGGEYTVQQLPNGLFAPWEGHWLFVRPRNASSLNANKVLTLIFSPTRAGGTTRSRSAGNQISNASSLNSQPAVNGPGSWALRLEARTGELSDSRNFVGMTTRATDGEDLTKVPKPPQPAPFVSLGISRPDSPNGLGLYAQDMRPIGGTKTWNVVVNTDQANKEVTLSWPEVRAVPRNYRLILTDKITGQTIDLRNQSSYKYNSGRSAEPRTFVLTARPTGLTGRALVTNIFVNPQRSNGRSAPIYEIGYSVSQDVRVEISVLSFGGRALAQVGANRSVTTGDNRVVWNGRDSAGRELPAGTYVLQVRAITSEGEVTREIRPLVLTGR